MIAHPRAHGIGSGVLVLGAQAAGVVEGVPALASGAFLLSSL